MLVTSNQPWWESSHHGNGNMLETPTFVRRCGTGFLIPDPPPEVLPPMPSQRWISAFTQRRLKANNALTRNSDFRLSSSWLMKVLLHQWWHLGGTIVHFPVLTWRSCYPLCLESSVSFIQFCFQNSTTFDQHIEPPFLGIPSHVSVFPHQIFF